MSATYTDSWLRGLNQRQVKVLKRAQKASDELADALVDRNVAIAEAVDLGIPVRTIGHFAGLSGAQISRLTS